jgi:hypothetical protein
MIEQLVETLRAHANPANVAGMARYGINTSGTLGVPLPVLRRMAKEAGRDHALAVSLWNSGIHEARIMATLVDDPALVTARQMDGWARDLDSWDVCDWKCRECSTISCTVLSYVSSKGQMTTRIMGQPVNRLKRDSVSPRQLLTFRNFDGVVWTGGGSLDQT